MQGAFILALLIPLLMTNYRNPLIWLMSLVSLALFINSFGVYLSKGILLLTFISLFLSIFFYFGKFKASVLIPLFILTLIFVFKVVFPISEIVDIERLYSGIEYFSNIFDNGVSIDGIDNLAEYGSTEAREADETRLSIERTGVAKRQGLAFSGGGEYGNFPDIKPPTSTRVDTMTQAKQAQNARMNGGTTVTSVNGPTNVSTEKTNNHYSINQKSLNSNVPTVLTDAR